MMSLYADRLNVSHFGKIYMAWHCTFNLVLMMIRSEDLFGAKLHFHATEKNRCRI